MKHLKLFFALFAMLALGVGNAWAEDVTISYLDIPDGYTATTGTSGSFTKTVSSTNDLTISYSGINTKSKASAADHAYGYAMFLKNYGYIYSSSAPTGYYPSKVVVKFGSQTGTSGKVGISFSNNILSSRNSSVTGAVSKNGTCTLTNDDKTKVHWNFSTTGANVQVASITVTYTQTGSTVTTYSVTLNQPTTGGTISATGLTDGKAAEGATVTLTATPATGYKFDSWSVTGTSGNIEVTNNQFTMPASDVTVSASFVAKTQYTIKWNVAEGSVDDTKVYEGDALGTLPTADNCSSGKVFIGWTEANVVNADGSDLVLAKATDVPVEDKEYNAVYAVQETGAGESGSADVTLADGVFDETNKKITWTTDGYATILQVKGTSGTDVANYTSAPRWYVGHEITFTPQSGVNITKIVIDQGATDKYKEFANATITNAEIVVDGQTVTLTPENGSNPVVIVPTKQLRPTAITIHKGAATSNSNYSLDCEANNEPFLTVSETAFDFGTLAQDETATETFTVTGGYLAEDVALTISGTNQSFFSVSPATITKADDVNETVTVTYNPTATGDHTATLTIKTGDITKEIALSGKVLAPGKWVLVKDIATLSAGDEIIIAAADADYAIGEAASNNYKGAAITKVGETANADAGVTVLKVEATGDAEVPYAFKTGSNYLYAASSSANQLKGKTTLDVNGQWAVTITEGVASIVAAKSSNRNVMQYNPNNGSPIFACYAPDKLQQPLAIYRNSENVVKPVISGDADFVGSTQVTITAQSGLTVYYTTDDTDPDNTSTQYTAPFTITETTTVKAIAYDASSNASGVAEMTFTKHDLVNVATAMALAKDEIAYFDEFEVVKVVTGTQYIYIKDANGHGLIYDLNLATQLSDGDRVQGFVGISAPYGGLPEAKPVDGLTVADLTITSGVAAEPYDFTSTAIAATDINKYVVFNDVEIATAVSMSNSNKEFSLTINGSNVAFYNQFSIEKTLEAGKTYDIYGFVSIYNEKLQVYFYQALEEGEVVTKYTVTYNDGGATGEVPVDDNEYTEGAQVYLKSATGLTKEGYDYKGWKVTDEGGNEIAVSSNKFNMPASNVTVTAQWEEIVAPEIQDFSTGYWVLVTDVNKIEDGDKIVIAAADENFAMKSYESGNNCKQVAVTKLGDQLLKWTSEIGVFQLIANGSNYTIQDVNTEQYLYAAGTEDKNYLKAANEVPTDAEDAKPYIWTISYTDGVATVKATSDNHNDLQYNKSADLFSCYASTQGKIALYKHVDTYTYTHTPTNKYGTICLPYASASTSGAYFYQVVGQGTENGKPAVYLESVNTLAAGVPYIFEATASTITVTYQGDPVAEAGTVNGLVGTFVETTVPDGDYILYNNAFCTNEPAGTLNKIRANRAYLNLDAVEGSAPTQMPGRRYIGMSVQGENEATGFENITAPAGKTVKAIVNGQLIIIRDGEMYNAQGVRF